MKHGGQISTMTDFFDEHYKEYDAWYERNIPVYLSELEAVKKALPSEGYGLEVGVGSGRFAAPLGITVGIDPSENMVKLARSRGVDARIGSGEELSFESSSFDYVAIIVAVCFAGDPEKMLEESARVLKPGGKIVIGIIDKDSSLGKAYQEKTSIFYGHARFFNVAEITKMLEREGFRDLLYFQTVFGRPDRIRSVQKPKKGYGKGGFVVVSAEKEGKERRGLSRNERKANGNGYLGRMSEPTASARVKGQCGEAMEFYLVVKDDVIREIKFYSEGCGGTLACGDMAARLASGKTIREALAISPRKVMEGLEGVGREHEHCSVLAVITLYKAIADHMLKKGAKR
jgi:SAM-dependent methyltransferase/NifU-like protein involved in Fe-S cluster formation